MATVLALGSPDDLCVRSLFRELDRRGFEMVLFPESDLSSQLGFNLVLRGTAAGGCLWAGTRRLSLEGVKRRLAKTLIEIFDGRV